MRIVRPLTRPLFGSYWFGYGFGALAVSDPEYVAGWAAVNRANAEKGVPQVEGDYFNLYYNLQNTLRAWSDGNPAPAGGWAAAAKAWTDALVAFLGGPAVSPPAVVPTRASQLHPDIAAVVTHFYLRYLHREPTNAADQEGLDFWTTGAVNGGAHGLADVENAFRVQAVNDGLYTNENLPAPEYFTIAPPADDGSGAGGGDPSDDDDQVPVYTGGGPTNTTNTGGGVLDSVENAIGGLLDKVSQSTGLSKRTIEVGAVVLGIGALFVFNSGGTSRSR